MSLHVVIAEVEASRWEVLVIRSRDLERTLRSPRSLWRIVDRCGHRHLDWSKEQNRCACRYERRHVLRCGRQRQGEAAA